MSDYAKRLGDLIFNNRKHLKMTQAELAEKAGITEQTIRKIEHGEGNPQLDLLYSLVTELQFDPTAIFYPGKSEDDPARKQLEIMLSDCNAEQIRALLPVVQAALEIVKAQSLSAAK